MSERPDLARARLRPARSDEDLRRAAEFLGTGRVRQIADASPEERGSVRLCEVDDRIVAAILFDPAPIRLRGVDVRCARIVETDGEDGRRRFRRTGDSELFDLVLEELLGYLWARRYPLAYAHGELALYTRHHFVPCFYHARIRIRAEAALRLPAPYRVRFLKSEDVWRIPHMRLSGRNSRPLVFAAGVPRFHHFCVESHERQLKGYFSLEVDPDSEWLPKVFIPEAEAEDRAAIDTILRHCAVKAREAGVEEIELPLAPGHPVASVCFDLGGRSEVKGAATDPALSEEMLHVVDPVRLVEALAPGLERALARLPAKKIPRTVPIATERGCWILRLEGGKVSMAAEPGEPPPDAIRLPYWAFTQILAGYRSARDVPADLTPKQLQLLRVVFPRTWPYSMPDPDHWEPKPPPLPLSERARKVVRKIELPWATA